MFRRKTLIVVGAGASMEVDLPSGKELTREIAKLLDLEIDYVKLESGDYLLWQACKIHAKQSNSVLDQYFQAARRIHDAMPQASSIDSFIDVHSGDKHIEVCGKLAIVRAILKAESRCTKLIIKSGHRNAQLNYSGLENTWFNRFWALLTQGCPLDKLPDRLASFEMVIFNYDRCIEHFLYHSIQNYYGIPPEPAAAILKSLKIYHPYGMVGHLPWQGSSPKIGFGDEPNVQPLLELSSEIRTFTEETDPASEEITKIHDAVLKAQMIVFLGFAFHPDNMALITPHQPDDSNTTIDYYATAHGMSNSNQEQIGWHLRKLRTAEARDNNYNIAPLTCVDFFDEYSKSLEFS